MPLIRQHDYWICRLSAAGFEFFLSTHKMLMCFYSGYHQGTSEIYIMRPLRSMTAHFSPELVFPDLIFFFPPTKDLCILKLCSAKYCHFSELKTWPQLQRKDARKKRIREELSWWCKLSVFILKEKSGLKLSWKSRLMQSHPLTLKVCPGFQFLPISDSSAAILLNLLNPSGPSEESRFTFLGLVSTSRY